MSSSAAELDLADDRCFHFSTRDRDDTACTLSQARSTSNGDRAVALTRVRPASGRKPRCLRIRRPRRGILRTNTVSWTVDAIWARRWSSFALSQPLAVSGPNTLSSRLSPSLSPRNSILPSGPSLPRFRWQAQPPNRRLEEASSHGRVETAPSDGHSGCCVTFLFLLDLKSSGLVMPFAINYGMLRRG